jgi:LPS-assembly lipoprotein
MKITYVMILIVTLLTSCGGWHPRGVGYGSDVLKGTKVYIENNNFIQFGNQLASTIRSSYKAVVVNDPQNAQYIINIQDASQKSQITSVVGGASSNTYDLSFTVKYNVTTPEKDKDGKYIEVIPNKTIKRDQFWQSNSTMQLAQNNEATRVYSNITNDATIAMINQIAILLPANSHDSTVVAKKK